MTGATDQYTYGFNRSDAEALLDQIRLAEKGVDNWQWAKKERGFLCAMFKTPVAGISAATGVNGETLPSASCTRQSMFAGVRGQRNYTETVYNWTKCTISGEINIIAYKIDGVWVVISADCCA